MLDKKSNTPFIAQKLGSWLSECQLYSRFILISHIIMMDQNFIRLSNMNNLILDFGQKSQYDLASDICVKNYNLDYQVQLWVNVE